MIKSCETSKLYVVLMVLQHSSVGNLYVGMPYIIYKVFSLVQTYVYEDFPQRYVVIPLAITTSNLFHSHLLLGSLHFKKILMIFNTLVCYYSIKLHDDCSIYESI